MYCNNCGHELNESGVCPICGWADQNPYANQQSYGNPQNPYGNQQPYGNPNPYANNPSYNHPQSNISNQNPQPYISPQPYGDYNYQNPYNQQQAHIIRPNGQPYANSQSPYTNPQTPGIPGKQKKRRSLFVGIGVAVLAVAIALVINLTRPVKDLTDDGNDDTEYTERTTEQPDSETPTTEQQIVDAGTKTLMIYMVGSDLESEHGAASDDIEEMLSSGYDEASMNVLIYTGGCTDWYNSDIPDDANTTFLIKDGALTELTSTSASNMGDPANLSEFLTYGYTNYPAEQYDLILWNHGGGAFFGYGYDETTGDSLTLDELAQAFEDSPFHDGTKLEMIGFDACLMANIETAHILSPYANYLVASQESEPGAGWYYGTLDDIDTAESGEDIGTAFVDSYIDETNSYLNSMPFVYCPISLSVLDLSKTESVETALNNLFAKVDDDFSASTYATYSAYRTGSKEIAADYSYTEGSYDVIDLVDYAGQLRASFPEEADALTSALSELIVYADANESGINGVSIYHPYYTKEYVSSLVPMYTTFDFAENYTDYISRFAGMLTDTDAFTVAWDPDTLTPTANADGSFSVTLQPEQTAAVQNAYFVIAKKEAGSDDVYDLVALSSSVENDGTDTYTADFDGQITYMQNNTTNETYELMYTVQEKTADYTRYLLSSILYNDDIQGADAMYAYFVLEVSDEHPEGVILGAYPIENYISTDGNELFPERYEIDVNDYKNVAFGYFSHRFTSNEDLTNFNESDWADVEINYSYFPIAEGFSPVRGGLLAGESYYGMFIFEDTQGNRHCSGMVQLQ